MSAFHVEFDVDRSPGEVWAYLSDPSHLPITRHVGRRDVPLTMRVTEFEPPRSWSMRGIDGPVRSRVHGEVVPLPDGRTRVTMDLDFEGHGVGRVLIPLVVRPQVRRELPENERLLKERLEHAAG